MPFSCAVDVNVVFVEQGEGFSRPAIGALYQMVSPVCGPKTV